MALSICTSCLARLRISNAATSLLPSASLVQSSSFHSSAAQQNVVKKKSVVTAGARGPKLRESRSARIKKKSRERPRPPPVGERKAQRKRIVLSNTNALEIQGLQKLGVNNMAGEDQIGKVLAFDGPLLDQLRDAKAFKTTQNWNMFRTPSTLVRTETVEVGNDVQDVNNATKTGDEPLTIHKLITGEKASGKSIHLLQAMSMAYLNKWVVINIPDCQEYILNQSAYSPVPNPDSTSPHMYIQPQLASDLLTRLAYSNSAVLSSLRPIHNHSATLPKSANKLKSLKDLALLGANEHHIAPQVWDAVWKELTVKPESGKEGSARPPVLLAVDGVNFWMGMTRYKSSDYQPIHAHQFTLIKQFVDLLFPTTQNPLPFGGIVMAATTKSNHPTTPTFEHIIAQIAHRQTTPDFTYAPDFSHTDPYMTKIDSRVWDLRHRSQHTDLVSLKGLSRPESRGLLEYFARSGIFKEAVTDGAVAEKWSLSGGGIVGELCKLSGRLRTGIFETGRREGVKMRA